jgi:hypothetical protein
MAAERSTDYIPNIVVGTTLYSHYPIRPIDKSEAEEMVERNKKQIIIRISDNSRNQGAYYVASFLYGNKVKHLLIKREEHDAGMGDLTEINKRKYGTYINFSEFTLPKITHDLLFMHTKIQSIELEPESSNSFFSVNAPEPGASEPGASEPGAPSKGGRHTRRSRSKKSKTRRSKKSKSRRSKKSKSRKQRK